MKESVGGLSVLCGFLPFLWSPWLNRAHSSMVLKISYPCTSWMIKLSLTIKTDYVTSNRKDLDLQGKDRGEKVDLEEGEIYHQKAKTNFRTPGENQTHKPPSSSLDVLTADSRHNILWLFVRISMLITIWRPNKEQTPLHLFPWCTENWIQQ